MKIVTHCHSGIGARAKNEDYAGVCKKGAWVVADGVGGSPAGDVASRGAVETLLKLWGKQPRLTVDRIAGIFEETNRIMRMHSLHDEELCGMRTTVAALFYRFGKVISAHVGDSRVYLFRKGKVRFQSWDHSSAREKTAPEEDPRYHEGRSQLLRVLGGSDDYLPELSEQFRVRRGDAFLLCTDGFWENVLESCMEQTLGLSKTPKEWVEQMLCRHAEAAPKNQDNYTVIAGFFR